MKRNDWTVGEHGVRPNGPPDECFYCRAKVGAQHRMGCVVRSRTVVVRLTIDYVRDIPEDWDAQQLEFFHNEGTRCSDNDIEDLAALCKRLDEDDSCLCSMSKVEFVREATQADEEANLLFVVGLPS